MASSTLSCRRIDGGLLSYSAYSPSAKVMLHSHAVAVKGKVVLIDPIMPDEEIFRSIASLGEPCSIFLSNGNHERAAPEISERLQIPVAACAYAVEHFTFKPEIIIDGSPQLQGLELIPLPGGGPGEYAFFENSSGTLFIGDAITNLDESGMQILPDKYCMDPHILRSSLKTLLPLPVQRILFAHGEPVVENAQAKLAALPDLK